MPPTLAVSDISGLFTPLPPLVLLPSLPLQSLQLIDSSFRLFANTLTLGTGSLTSRRKFTWYIYENVFDTFLIRFPLPPAQPPPPCCCCCSGIVQHFQRLRLTIRVRNLIKSAVDRHFLAWQLSKFQMSNEMSTSRISFAVSLRQLVWLLEISNWLPEILKWSICSDGSADKQLMFAHQSSTERLKKGKQTIPKWPGQANQYK